MKLSGNFLKFTRNMMQLSQAELAEKLGITRGLLSMIEAGQRVVSYKTEQRFWQMLEAEGIGLFELTKLFERYQEMKRGKKNAD